MEEIKSLTRVERNAQSKIYYELKVLYNCSVVEFPEIQAKTKEILQRLSSCNCQLLHFYLAVYFFSQ